MGGRNMISIAKLVLVACLGCEMDYGINRGVDLAVMPAPECVSEILHSTPEISSVEEDHSDSFHRYRYEGDNFWAYASFGRDAAGGVWFLHQRISVDEKPSEDEVTKTRAMMRLVEQRLAAECNVPELRTAVREECVGVDCRQETGE